MVSSDSSHCQFDVLDSHVGFGVFYPHIASFGVLDPHIVSFGVLDSHIVSLGVFDPHIVYFCVIFRFFILKLSVVLSVCHQSFL